MSKFLAALGLSTALAAAAAVPLATQAQAAMSYGGQGVADLQHQMAPVEKAQFFWGGNNWCWYPIGWHGPGWYWCGYDWNNGYGWGGAVWLERLVRRSVLPLWASPVVPAAAWSLAASWPGPVDRWAASPVGGRTDASVDARPGGTWPSGRRWTGLAA